MWKQKQLSKFPFCEIAQLEREFILLQFLCTRLVLRGHGVVADVLFTQGPQADPLSNESVSYNFVYASQSSTFHW